MAYKHLSVRVPWHDNCWNGKFCNNPNENASCLFLPRINLYKNADDERAGEEFPEFIDNEMPPCIAERCTFMCPRKITRKISHPYTKTNEQYKHFLPKTFPMPPYSFAAVPFRWMRKDHNDQSQIAEEYNIDYDSNYEPDLGFSSGWVQDHRNQKALLNKFFEPIIKGKSLCFFYAKHVPFYENGDRVLIGVGRILRIGEIVEYDYKENGTARSVIWERMIQHSIREDFSDGFVLPYQELFEKSKKNSEINMEDFVVKAPDWDQFSYATEHVTHDVAIDSILALEQSLKKISQVLDKKFTKQFEWINDRISELWKSRGAYPGFGSVLSAMGIEEGNLIAWEVSNYVDNNYDDPLKIDLWNLMEDLFRNSSKFLPKELASKVGETCINTWNGMSNERKEYIKLLSRFELTNEQALCFYDNDSRKRNNIELTDQQLLENPYLFFEESRFLDIGLDFSTIDKGIFPSDIIRKQFPLSKKTNINEATDKRRIRALIVEVLEDASEKGHSLLPNSNIIQQIFDRAMSPKCPINSDILNAIESTFEGVIVCDSEENNKTYQLKRLFDSKEIISHLVKKRIEGTRHEIETNWEELLNNKLGKYTNDEIEDYARKEKIASLKELSESRFSVLIGSAGTGKTTLLSVLCNQPDIKRDGILLLAPTGKARVRMSSLVGQSHKAQTIAQFLLQWERYDDSTGRYFIAEKPKYDGARTVIIDEASMLTEEQLGALIDSMKGVKRFILVGDYRQLPPIGTGRPFVDIITFLREKNNLDKFPKIGRGYAELSIIRRQNSDDPSLMEDVKLAKWFSGNPLLPIDDDIFDVLAGKNDLERIKLISWSDTNDLHSKILDSLVEELKLKDKNDEVGFELSLGGKESNGYVYFNSGCENYAENWQILSPVKGQGFGTKELNRLIQRIFRKDTIDLAEDFMKKQIPPPLGQDRIVYGDKVINVINKRRYKVYPKEDSLNYVANGEIGIVTGMFRGKYQKWSKGVPLPININFSSQPGYSYTYGKKDFDEEGESSIELAYVITVHKSQGSDFKLSFLILPNPCNLLSRELLYTALTRQKERVLVFHQGDIRDFKKYSYDNFSETNRRITNLFYKPNLLEIGNLFFEDRLISKTPKGQLVRSKSELVIGTLLEENNIEYSYERKLIGKDGAEKFPDFTIDDEDAGVTYYWEHLGMLPIEAYRKKWEEKLKWYKDQDILGIDEGGGEKGTLIITKDSFDGGLDAAEIKKIIKKIQ